MHLFVILGILIGVGGHPSGQLPQLPGAFTNGEHKIDQSTHDQYAHDYLQDLLRYRTNEGVFFPQLAQELRQRMNSVGEHLNNAGESLSNFPRNFVDNFGHRISNTFDSAYQSGLEKLHGLQDQLSAKFRPLVAAAIEIFQRPGTEKQHWNELVERVESTNLSEHEKQELYQKVANATIPQHRK